MRRRALGLRRVNEDALLGDPLGAPASTDQAAAALRQVREWWAADCNSMVPGALLIGRALCLLLEWGVLATVPVARLRAEFGFPDPEPVRRQRLDSL
jgi:hypothetical protein